MFRAVYDFFCRLLGGAVDSTARREHKKPLPEISYASLGIRADKISHNSIGKTDFFCQIHNNKYKWVMFKCPCRCGDVITLSLQSIHKPFWVLSLSDSKRPTLNPSVWRDKGCFSHFWIRDGRVFWCVDTGSDPRLRKYSVE